jgi:hypothetical protein
VQTRKLIFRYALEMFRGIIPRVLEDQIRALGLRKRFAIGILTVNDLAERTRKLADAQFRWRKMY